MTRRPFVLLTVFFTAVVFVACGNDDRSSAEQRAANDATDTDGGVADETDATTKVDAAKVDAARGCPELCDRALECLNLGGYPASRQSCMAWCSGKVQPQAVGACELCFETEQCTTIFNDPRAPWDLTRMNPGTCIEECGLGTCERDGDCSPAGEICTAVGDKITCTSSP